DATAVHELRERARLRLDAARAPGPADAEHPDGAPSLERRLGDVRLIARALDRLLAGWRPVRPGATVLSVDARGAWFELTGRSRVDCSRRHVLGRILLVLARARLANPGQPVPRDQLVAAGWPGQRIL